MEYYGYAERSADSQVDWSAISKSMSDMLTEKNKIREDKKAALDQASRDASNHLVDVPLGQHVGANEFALRFTDNASKYQLMQDRLLKQGALGLKEYTVARQNLLDDTDKTFKMLGNFKTQADEIMARTDAGENQKLELEQMSRISDWGNLDQSDLYINPTTGSMTIGRVTTQTIDGKTVRTMTKNPKEFTTISNANATMYERHNKFNLNTPVDNIVDKMGDQLDVLRNYGSETRAGNIISVLDVTRKTGATDKNGVVQSFLKMEDNAIEGILSNKYDRLSLLTENIATKNGLPYRFVYTPEEAKGHPEAIYMETQAGSGRTVPVLSEEQMYDSTEYLRSQMRLRYDKKTTMNPYNEPTKQKTEADYKGEESTKRKIESASLWNEVYSANTPEERKVALEAVLQSPFAQARGIKDIDFTSKPGFMIIKNDDPKLNSQPIDLANVKNLGGWSRIGAAIHGITDKNIISKATGGGSPGFSRQMEYEGLGRVSRGGSVEAEYKNYIDSTTPELTTAISSGKSGASTEELQSLYGDLGFKFKNNNPLIGNTVIITAPLKGEKGEKPTTTIIDVSNKAKAQEAIKKFISANLNPEKLDVLSKQGRFETGAVPTENETPGELD